MPEQQAKKWHTYAQILAIIVTAAIGISSHLMEKKDSQARKETEKAASGYSEHSKTLMEMSKDIRLNRELILTALRPRVITQPTPPPLLPEKKPKLPPIRKQQPWNKLNIGIKKR